MALRVGYRLAVKHPERIEAILVQNGNAYDEGLDNDFWKPLKAYWNDRSDKNAQPLRGFLTAEATKWQYTHGVRDITTIDPDTWLIDQTLMIAQATRISNSPCSTATVATRRCTQSGKTTSGSTSRRRSSSGAKMTRSSRPRAHPYKRDLKNLEFHLLDTGHFALEEDGAVIAGYIRQFLGKHVANPSSK